MRTLTRRFVLLAAMTAPLGAYGVNAQSGPKVTHKVTRWAGPSAPSS